MSSLKFAAGPGSVGRSQVRRYIARGVALLAALLFAIGSFAVVSPFGSQVGVYLADRNVGLGLLLLALLFAKWDRPLGAVLLATAAMHLVDGIGDLALQNLPAAIGSIVVALTSAVAGWWLLREPGGQAPAHPGNTTEYIARSARAAASHARHYRVPAAPNEVICEPHTTR